MDGYELTAVRVQLPPAKTTIKKVWVTTSQTQLELTIGSANVLVNGEERILDSAPFITGNRTMLPFRFIAEELGFDVSWDDQTKEIKLTFPPRR